MGKKPKYVIFLRKKTAGQNSVEEIASTLIRHIPEAELKIFPTYGRTPPDMLKNIRFAIKNRGLVNHFISPSDVYAGLFIRGKKILTWHDVKTLFQSKSKLKRWLRKLLYLYPTLYYDKITVISDFTKKELEDWLPTLSENKIIVINNPLNPAFEPYPKKNLSSPPVIFHPGTAKRKNLDKVINALKGFDVKLNIIGKLDDSQKQLLEDSGLEFTNAYDIDLHEMVDCYRECDIVSFPSSYEGFGMPVIEAQMTGRPVVTSPISPLKEISGDAACFVNPDEPGSIKEGFIRLINDENFRKGLVEKGHCNALKFTPQNICRQYMELYEACLK